MGVVTEDEDELTMSDVFCLQCLSAVMGVVTNKENFYRDQGLTVSNAFRL